MTDAAAADLDLQDLLRRMLRGRRFDERVLAHRELIRGHFHVSLGLEAVAAAVTAALRPDDRLITTYRNHALLAALGSDLGTLLGEILGRGSGPQRGRSGSTHLSDPDRGVPHTSALVSGGISHALGIALVLQRDESGGVCFCVFGEGAFGEGAVHEALNIAALWQLPIVFVCENNAPPSERAAPMQAADSFVAIAEVHGVDAVQVDGGDITATASALQRAADATRAGGGPHFVEAVVPPFPGNATFFPHDATTEAWEGVDPIRRATQVLLEAGIAADRISEIDRAVVAEVDAADARATAAAPPEPSHAANDVVSAAAAPRPSAAPLAPPDGDDVEYWVARWTAVDRELASHPDALLLGAYLTLPFSPPDELLARHGDRVLWPPTSEMSIMGMGVGAAMQGARPLVPIGTSSFMFYGWPQIVAEAPNVRYLSGGKVTAPVVFHVMAGSRRASGVQHEHTPQAMLQNVPGLVILAPGTPADVDGLLAAAFELDDPVFFVDHLLLNHTTGPVGAEPQRDIGRAALLREGGDVLLVAYSSMVPRALAAAAELEQAGVSAAVLNLRTLAPLPLADVIELSREHPAVLFVDEARGPGSTASYLAARVAEACPTTRLGLCVTADAPAPFNEQLLDEIVPTVSAIVARATQLVSEPEVSER